MDNAKYFLSYARVDEDFALKLGKDLRANGLDIWIDQLDVQAGERWDRVVEQALHDSRYLVVVLSPDAVASENVMDEVTFALEEKKQIIPVLYKDCNVPLRIRRMQRIEFNLDYDTSFRKFCNFLNLELTAEKPEEGQKVPDATQPDVKAKVLNTEAGAPDATTQEAPSINEPAKNKKPPRNNTDLQDTVTNSTARLSIPYRLVGGVIGCIIGVFVLLFSMYALNSLQLFAYPLDWEYVIGYLPIVCITWTLAGLLFGANYKPAEFSVMISFIITLISGVIMANVGGKTNNYDVLSTIALASGPGAALGAFSGSEFWPKFKELAIKIWGHG